MSFWRRRRWESPMQAVSCQHWVLWYSSTNWRHRYPGTRVPISIPVGYPGFQIPESPSTNRDHSTHTTSCIHTMCVVHIFIMWVSTEDRYIQLHSGHALLFTLNLNKYSIYKVRVDADTGFVLFVMCLNTSTTAQWSRCKSFSLLEHSKAVINWSVLT